MSRTPTPSLRAAHPKRLARPRVKAVAASEILSLVPGMRVRVVDWRDNKTMLGTVVAHVSRWDGHRSVSGSERRAKDMVSVHRDFFVGVRDFLPSDVIKVFRSNRRGRASRLAELIQGEANDCKACKAFVAHSAQRGWHSLYFSVPAHRSATCAGVTAIPALFDLAREVLGG